jgi:hypothetical protein
MQLLSKSSYLLGLQCPKLLWTKINKKERIPDVDKALQHRFDEGTKIGKLATSLFKKGIYIPEDFKQNLEETKELIKKRVALFEPSFMIEDLYSRADILKPVGKDKWDIIEVKSSTEVKEVNLHDLSFQKHIYEKSGLKIRKCFLMHINNKYIRKGKISTKKLFKIENVTKEVKDISKGIEDRILLMQEVINNKEPEVKINYNCKKPYPCQIMDHCWGFLPEKNHVFHLYRGGKKSFSLFEDGIIEIVDIPEDFKLNVKQIIQKETAKTGKAHINKKGIKEFLETLEYPLYFLDFETYQTAIPLYNGLKPYQQIPFQYSLHIQEEKNGKLQHISYLAKGKKDPRKSFMKSLIKNLGDKGSVVVYNQSFEKMILRQLGEKFLEYQDWVSSIDKRIVDLLVPFRNFDYYHPKQKGSASIKKVLPVLVGKGYEGMDIADGGMASLEYLYITHIDSSNTNKVRKALERYCELDTLAEVWILEKLLLISTTK